MQLKIKKLHKDAVIPKYQTFGAACFDIHAVGLRGPHVLVNSSPLNIRTGLAFEIPQGYVMLVYSRGGFGFKHATRLVNCVGVIDCDYRGELMVSLIKDPTLYTSPIIRNGDRIAQAMVVPYPRVEFVEVDELSPTVRGDGGFGSTGL